MSHSSRFNTRLPNRVCKRKRSTDCTSQLLFVTEAEPIHRNIPNFSISISSNASTFEMGKQSRPSTSGSPSENLMVALGLVLIAGIGLGCGFSQQPDPGLPHPVARLSASKHVAPVWGNEQLCDLCSTSNIRGSRSLSHSVYSHFLVMQHMHSVNHNSPRTLYQAYGLLAITCVMCVGKGITHC